MMEQETQQRMEALENEVKKITELLRAAKIEEQSRGIDLGMPIEQQDEMREIVFDALTQYFFEKSSFISFPFSESGSWSSFSVFNGESRLTDTAEGKFLNTGKSSRTRCQFYVENPDEIEAYLLSPAVYDSFVSLNTFTSMDILRSYVGLKIRRGVITVCVKQAGGQEENYPTEFSLSGSGASDTLVLEMIHGVLFTDVFIDSKRIGTFASNLAGRFSTTKTFLPLFAPVRCLNVAESVNLVVENFQFIQEK